MVQSHHASSRLQAHYPRRRCTPATRPSPARCRIPTGVERSQMRETRRLHGREDSPSHEHGGAQFHDELHPTELPRRQSPQSHDAAPQRFFLADGKHHSDTTAGSPKSRASSLLLSSSLSLLTVSQPSGVNSWIAWPGKAATAFISGRPRRSRGHERVRRAEQTRSQRLPRPFLRGVRFVARRVCF
jgi:hypothetical protein